MTATVPELRGVPLARRLAQFGDSPALLTADAEVSYAELADRVDRAGELLGATRCLVLLTGGNDVDTVFWYLAALAGGHPVMLAGSERDVAGQVAAYGPDVVIRSATPTERREGTAHELRPGLALLLATSRSTGSPRLVRLSAGNV